MDILEHVEKPALLVQEASRVLRRDGLFFFHTFNRNWLSYLLIIKGVDWFVKNAPKNMHVYPLFITPQEIKEMCHQEKLEVDSLIGLIPQMGNLAFWKMLITRQVPKNFSFCFVKNLLTGYCGIAKKS
jgi:2-polyprenyl-6-hydroxyphenyl methylase/3-demethylubiquinone-9 3-methyltransferase